MWIKKIALVMGLLASALGHAHAQQPTNPCYQTTANAQGVVGCQPTALATPLPVILQTPAAVLASGCASKTDTSTATVITAPAATSRIYITSISVANTGATPARIDVVSDPASATTIWSMANPAGTGSNASGGVLAVAALGKAVGFTASAGSSTQTVCVAGYVAP